MTARQVLDSESMPHLVPFLSYIEEIKLKRAKGQYVQDLLYKLAAFKFRIFEVEVEINPLYVDAIILYLKNEHKALKRSLARNFQLFMDTQFEEDGIQYYVAPRKNPVIMLTSEEVKGLTPAERIDYYIQKKRRMREVHPKDYYYGIVPQSIPTDETGWTHSVCQRFAVIQYMRVRESCIRLRVFTNDISKFKMMFRDGQYDKNWYTYRKFTVLNEYYPNLSIVKKALEQPDFVQCLYKYILKQQVNYIYRHPGIYYRRLDAQHFEISSSKPITPVIVTVTKIGAHGHPSKLYTIRVQFSISVNGGAGGPVNVDESTDDTEMYVVKHHYSKGVVQIVSLYNNLKLKLAKIIGYNGICPVYIHPLVDEFLRTKLGSVRDCDLLRVSFLLKS